MGLVAVTLFRQTMAESFHTDGVAGTTDAGIPTRNLRFYEELHRVKRYGTTGHRRRRIVEPLARTVQPKSVLDYGAGQSSLADDLRISSIERRDKFDPAIPALRLVPGKSYDLILCTDVLEHIHEDEVGALIEHIFQHSPNAVFCVHTGVARTILSNGENAHATVRPAKWWAGRIGQIFPYARVISDANNVATITTFPVPTLTRLWVQTIARWRRK